MPTQTASSQRLPRLVGDASGPPTYNQLFEASDGLRYPVFMPGLCSDTTAVRTWTLDRLLGLDPQERVRVEYYVDADRRKRYRHVEKPCVELAEAMAADPEKWLIADQNFDQVFPAASDELPWLPVVPVDARHAIRSPFFGTNSQSATHFHTIDQAVLAHLRGVKKVVLAGPRTTKQLATNSPFGRRPQFSTFGPEAGGDALEFFTDLLGDEAFMVELNPGDALFIPVHWWHWVEGRGECLSVTTFWRAALKEWAWPTPGIRAATAFGIAGLLHLIRGVLARVKR